MKNKNYVTPQVEVVDIEIEGVLCQSTNGVLGADLQDGSVDIFGLPTI